MHRTALRLLSGAGLAWGTLLLVRPRQVTAALAPEFPADRRWVVRVLGLRLVAQYAALLAAPRRPVADAATGVDAVHAASMLPWLASPTYRRAAAISGAAAAGSAVLTGALTRR